MLTLTENAATVIERLVARGAEGGKAGLRIISGQKSRPSDMKIEIATEPKRGDEIVELAGARVYLDSDAAAALSSKELDAVVDDNAVNFTVRNR